MLGASLILAATLAGFAGWLHYNERVGWPEESDTQLDDEYRDRRRRRRTVIHFLLLSCGVLAAAAGFAGKGRVWIGCWMTISLTLMVIIVLALLDGFRTHRYLKRKLPEIRRDVLED